MVHPRTMSIASDNATLDVLVVARLLRLFRGLKWTINSEVEGAHPYEDVFNDFAELLSYLGRDEQDLILTLTEDYLHCTTLQYPILLNQALSKIPSVKFRECDAVFLVPLKAPKDKGKVKSADAMLYGSRVALPNLQDLSGKVFKKYSDPDLLKKEHSNRKRSLILLVDDFIGTGDTAEAALQDYNLRLRVDDDEPIVVTLVAQEQGVDKLVRLGFSVVAVYVRKRGISDNPKVTDKPRAVELMKGIEAQIKILKAYSFGYGETEALVSMMRTPNNTFPVYWWPRMPQGRLRNTPFKRDNI